MIKNAKLQRLEVIRIFLLFRSWWNNVKQCL